MECEHLMILDLIDRGRISVCEALELLEALGESPRASQPLFSPDEPLTIEVSLS